MEFIEGRRPGMAGTGDTAGEGGMAKFVRLISGQDGEYSLSEESWFEEPQLLGRGKLLS